MTFGPLAQPVRTGAERMKKPLFQHVKPGCRITNAEQTKLRLDTTTT